MTITGLLGGSFNPAHGGHRKISLEAIRTLGLDEVWWLVSPGNPLKPRAGMAPLSVRVASAVRKARRAPIRVTAIERELHTPLYRRHLAQARAALPEAALRVADGRGQPEAVSPLARVAKSRATHADCGYRASGV